MYRDEDRLVVSATDLVGYLSCPHYTTMSLAGLGGGRRSPSAPAAPSTDGDQTDLDVVQRRGLEHEAAYLAQLELGLDALAEAHIDTAGDLGNAVAAIEKVVAGGTSSSGGDVLMPRSRARSRP